MQNKSANRSTRSQPFMLVMTWTEAKAAGLTRYYSGVPCTHGHRSERMVSDTHCVECKRVKSRLRPPPSSIREVRRERYRSQRQRHYRANRDRIVAQVVSQARHRLDNDPVFRLRHTIRGRIANLLRKNCKTGSAIEMLSCTVEELKAYLEGKFQPGMTWDDRRKWHIDHVKPLSAFDLSDPAQLAKACHYTNLQPLWAADNMRKGATVAA